MTIVLLSVAPSSVTADHQSMIDERLEVVARACDRTEVPQNHKVTACQAPLVRETAVIGIDGQTLSALIDEACQVSLTDRQIRNSSIGIEVADLSNLKFPKLPNFQSALPEIGAKSARYPDISTPILGDVDRGP